LSTISNNTAKCQSAFVVHIDLRFFLGETDHIDLQLNTENSTK